MNDVLFSQLKQKYPHELNSLTEISCGDGWYSIIDVALKTICTYTRNIEKRREWAIINNAAEVYDSDKTPRPVPESIDFRVVQIKEKFGELRVYSAGADDFINGVISMSEMVASKTCEVCGERGKMRHGSWIRILCDEHAPEEK